MNSQLPQSIFLPFERLWLAVCYRLSTTPWGKWLPRAHWAPLHQDQTALMHTVCSSIYLCVRFVFGLIFPYSDSHSALIIVVIYLTKNSLLPCASFKCHNSVTRQIKSLSIINALLKFYYKHFVNFVAANFHRSQGALNYTAYNRFQEQKPNKRRACFQRFCLAKTVIKMRCF